jgi:hypothetical protein
MSTSTRQMIATSHGCLAVEESGQGDIPSVADPWQFVLPWRFPQSDARTDREESSLHRLRFAGSRAIQQRGRSETQGVAEAVVFGWSLGGHIGIELMSRFPGMRGLMISGAPPVSHNQMSKGFNASPHLGVAGNPELS